MDIIELLMNDHEKLRRQLVIICRCLSQSDLREKVNSFIISYKLHEAIEDKILFAKLDQMLHDLPDRRSMIAAYGEKHRDVWSHMSRLTETMESTHYKGIQQVFFRFSAAVEMHMRDEERVLFPMIREFVDSKILENLGAEAESCLHAAVRAKERISDALLAAYRVGVIHKPERILIPVDFSGLSLGALDFGIMLAGQLDAQLFLLYVEEPYYQFESYTILNPDLKGIEARLWEVYKERIEKWSDDLPFSDETKVEVFVRQGKIVEEVLKAANELGSDIILMGTHGRKGIARAILGSVTEQIIRRAPCPVIAIRSGTSPFAEKKVVLENR